MKISFRRIFKIIRNIILGLFAFSIISVILLRFVPVYFTPLMGIRVVQKIASGEKPKMDKTWVPIEEISPNLIAAVIASEDNEFVTHNGFSIQEIKDAIEYNKKHKGKRIHGGSTISQQTAKNVFLWQKRSWVRKGLEAYFTVLIEFFWSKERIMEVYLNVIEMGDGIYGAEAAAENYFHTTAAKLSRQQSILIAVCLPNPRRFSPANPSPYIQKRLGQISSLLYKMPEVNFDQKKIDKEKQKEKELKVKEKENKKKEKSATKKSSSKKKKK